jgi:hypothetical protein
MQSEKLLFTTVKQLRDFKSEETPPAAFTFGASIFCKFEICQPTSFAEKVISTSVDSAARCRESIPYSLERPLAEKGWR